MADDSDTRANFVELTAEIVAAYVSKNSIARTDLPALIAEVHRSLSLLAGTATPPVETKPVVPAVSIRKSVTADAITCLECGLTFKSIKRHIGTSHDMTPEQYRERWGLPRDYPMVAPAYSERRSALAKENGLGRKPGVQSKTRGKRAAT